MNVLILSKSLHRGGIETHVLNLAEKLKGNGHVVMVASDNLKEKSRFDRFGIPVKHIGFLSHSPIAVWRNCHELKRIIRQEHIDIVHCQWRICTLYMEALKRFYGVKTPYVWSNHVFSKPSQLKRFFTFYGEKAIVSSIDCYEGLIRDYKMPPSDVELIYIGIEREKYRNDASGIDELRTRLGLKNEFVITMLCRLEKIKNHKCMIEALNILVNEKHVDNIKCVIVGEGKREYTDELKSLIEQYKLEDVVIFAGYTESISTLGLTDVMALPSQAEGFPISVIEAFAMRVPVIRTRTGGYTDVKGLCLDMDFNDSAGLADRICKVMAGGEEINAMVDRACAFVENNCTSDVMLRKIEEVYQAAIGKN